jgi:hypothetical protein
MEKLGTTSAKELKNLYDCEQDSGRIIYKNFYGWFKKLDRGIYTLSDTGKNFLNGNEFKELIDYYRKQRLDKNET